ncbi:Heterokaryon incompatibility protein 6, OR allele [Colletotrichum siamense]|uniref:Heterokaryon incompatibility protein 6, OR allele n=1 Tax=Colletotrichum siamense TaxID=690259 RepID=A0A9P5EK06_COLSI|nr:Heterokaryon incompatibility protein 6, OR allele [Colletotrichum siamense]KAF4848799.1 Heterokaryon incompatibility protein 6, OR allele [Colletotrichum siamense]
MRRRHAAAARNTAYRHRRRNPRQGAIKPVAKISYNSLSGTQIRLLRIMPGVGRVKCQLRTVYLSEDPRYHALSYVWGDSKDMRWIKVNGTLFPVTVNLYDALIAFRKVPSDNVLSPPFLIWVDAICINQHDEKEKNRQIPRIGQIYAAAERVIIWLSSCIQWWYDQTDLHTGFFHHQANTRPSWPDLGNRFQDHPWFDRIWTVQEAVLTKTSPIFAHAFDGFVYTATLDWIDGLAKEMKHSNQGIAWNNLVEMRSWAEKSHSSRDLKDGNAGSMLIMLLNLTSMKTSSILQDRIYGLYGLLQALNTRFPELRLPVVDYSRPPGQIFTDITKLIIQHTGDSMFIRSASCGRRVPEAPTWVSDFYFPFSETRTGPFSDQPPELSDDGKVLIITANIIDFCEIVAPVKAYASMATFEDRKMEVIERIKEIEDMIIRPLLSRRSVDSEYLWSAVLSNIDFKTLVKVREAEFDGAEWLSNERVRYLHAALKRSLFFCTREGYIGRCSSDVPCQSGDVICVTSAREPFIIRRTNASDQYEVIGSVDRYEDGLKNLDGGTFNRIQLI